MDNIRVLVIGNKNKYEFPSNTVVCGAEALVEEKCADFDIAFILAEPLKSLFPALYKHLKAYTVFFASNLEILGHFSILYKRKKGQLIDPDKVQDFINNDLKNFFPKPYGEKYNMQKLTLCQGFKGKAKWDGNYALEIEGDFGDRLSQIAYLRMFIPIHRDQALDFWFEYEKGPGVEVALDLTMFRTKNLSEELNRWVFTEKQLEDIVTIEAGQEDGYLFMSFSARGSGKIKIIALHSHYSRRGYGHFIPGGERFVTRNREELFTYFDPGDRKPPLNVYFSGYKTKEGFEGYGMMKRLGCPFLLIGEPRLEGGAFYIGSREYEKAVEHSIKKCMKELEFNPSDVVMSGVSMGSFGAAYYACEIMPKVILLGKPLLNIGDVAYNERIKRPGGFPTSLDVLKHMGGSLEDNAVNKLNIKFFRKFRKTPWTDTKVIVSYMLEDDYDATAYNDIISSLNCDGIEVYGRGLHGRHNDDTYGIFQWFSSQHKDILRYDYHREIDD